MNNLYARIVIKYWNNEINLPNNIIEYYMRKLGAENIQKLPIPAVSAIVDGMKYWI